MITYDDYKNILYQYNWTGQGDIGTVQQLPTTGLTPKDGIYTIGYNFLLTQSSLNLTGYYDTITNDIGSDGIYDPEYTHFRTLTSSQKDAFNIVMHKDGSYDYTYSMFFSDVANIQFSSEPPETAEIVIGQNDGANGEFSNNGQVAYTKNYGSGFVEEKHGDIWLNEDFVLGWNDLEEGGVQFETVIHELGHSLGLKGDGFLAGLEIDNQKYTIMSYQQAPGMDNIVNSLDVYPYTLQLYDIAALQEIYGINWNKASGDTNWTVSAMNYSSDLDDAFLYTIWDGSGADDTIDASDLNAYSSASVEIDLRQGRFSSIGEDVYGFAIAKDADATTSDPDPGNVAIAYNAIIENAVGTDQGDTLIGNAWDNKLEGGDGNDYLYGDGVVYDGDAGYGASGEAKKNSADPNSAPAADKSGDDELIGGDGNDHLFGGAGNDILKPGAGSNQTIDGGDGNDTVDYSDLGAGITVDMDAGTDSLGGTLTSIENAILTSYDDEITVGSGSTIIDGGAGNDTVTVFSYPLSNSYIDGGAGAEDKLIYTYSENANQRAFGIIESNTIEANFGFATNFEKIEFSNTYATFLSKEIGYEYSGGVLLDYSQHENNIQVNYSESGLTIEDLATGAFDVAGGGGVIGTTGDDIFNISSSSSTVWLGTGNDVLTITEEVQIPKIIYSGGNDVIKLYGYGINDVYMNNSIYFDSDIQSNDISVRSENLNLIQTNNSVNDSYEEVYRGDIVFDISGKGSLTLEEINIIYGYKALYDPDHPEYGVIGWDYSTFLPLKMASIDLWSGETILAGGWTSGLGVSRLSANTFVQLDATPYAAANLVGTSSNDEMNGYSYDDTLNGADGDDRIYGNFGNDVLIGGLGDDVVHGEMGNDTFVAGFGDDVLIGGSGIDVVDYSEVVSGITISLGGSKHVNGNDNGDGQGGFDTLKDIENAIGTVSVDSITGSDDDNVITGGQGADYLYGEDGDDTFVWNLGDGDDVLEDYSGEDSIKLGAGITANDISCSLNSSDLLVEIGSETITITNQFSGSSSDQIETIELDDGQVIDLTQNLTFAGSDQADNLSGTSVNDILDAKEGDDNVSGGLGSDTYVWRLLDGNDVFDDIGGTDVFSLIGAVTQNDISFSSDLTDLFIHIGSETITIKDHAWSSDKQIEMITFDDNSTLDLTNNLTFYGEDVDNGSNFETIYGTSFDDIIYGLAGHEYVLAAEGNDRLYGGDNYDDLYGGAGNDYFEGGAGGDYLYDSEGNETYHYEIASDLTGDRIYDDAGFDIITLGASITSNDISFRAGSGGTNLYIQIGNDELRLTGHANDSSKQVERLVFADGTEIDLTTGLTFDEVANGAIYGTAFDDILIADMESSALNGGSGNDRYHFETAQDLDFDFILDGGGLEDIITLGSSISMADIYFDDQDANLPDGLTIYAGSYGFGIFDQFNVQYPDSSVEYLQFSDGFTFDLANYQDWYNAGYTGSAHIGSANDEVIIGDSSANTFNGLAGNDYFIGGAGNDLLIGGSGNDTLNGGDGIDTADYSNASAGVVLSLHGSTATDDGEGDTDSLISIENIIGSAFADTLYGSDGENVINAGAGNDAVYARDSNDTIYGEDGDDIVRGGDGDDTIYGGAGNDSNLNGDDGNDEVHGGTGNDTIYGWTGNDTLYGDDGDDTLQGNAGTDIIDGGDGIDTVSYSAATSGVSVNLTTGVVSDDGEGGSDTLSGIENIIGSGYDDIFVGASGANLIDGGAGTDTVDYSDASNGIVISLHGSTATDDGEGTVDTFISIENIIGSAFADTIYGSDGVNTIMAGDGNDAVYARDANDILHGGDGNDIVRGGDGNDTIYGDAGNDINLNGDAGDDTVYGGEGNDTLYGWTGNDTLYGGTGSDTLSGNAGADTFVFQSSETGIDTITDFNLSDNDVLDISDLLSAYDPMSDAITDFVQITDNGTDSTLAIDVDGGADNFVTIAILSDVTGLTDEAALVSSGDLFV